ncbi:hypothetical protein ABH959_000319 [Bacillus sp. RC51]|uniref:Uncharacterized protein n=1 Tax=Bacillus mycoides TaxID=1405 RepID=A0A3D9UXN9_BACMY|nr:hypothetical protein DET63_11615 [Bacillus sp. DB-2]REF33989.1 hypothetical protein DET55_111153 [Bacillus mycoides]
MSSSGYVPGNKNLKKSSGTPNLFFSLIREKMSFLKEMRKTLHMKLRQRSYLR